METVIFTDKVERLTKEPIDAIGPPTTPIPTLSSNITNFFSIAPDNIAISDIIVQNSISVNNSTETEDDFLDRLKEERDNAIDKRMKKNDRLFIKIIEYWLAMVFISCLVYFIMKNYKECKKLEKRNGVVDVPSRVIDEESLELVDINSYRRSSVDDEHLETNVTQNGKHIKVLKKIGHYIMFGVCILSFQYFFFQNIVLVYDPLSIEEVKYIVYKELYPKYKEWIAIFNY